MTTPVPRPSRTRSASACRCFKSASPTFSATTFTVPSCSAFASNDDAPDVAVCLAEECHRAGRERLLQRHRARMHIRVAQDRAVHLVLDPPQLLRRQRAAEREVEAKIRGVHERAGLMHVLAENATQ